MSSHPYQSLPEHCFWRPAVAAMPPAEVDPVHQAPFRITREHRIATAGSCFAQHIARHLREHGFQYFVTEPGHAILSPEVRKAYGYGIFTARYGNIYTPRQLLQLFLRAYGRFQPKDDLWREGDRILDPFRPQIQPGGFATTQEYAADRQQHFAAVRAAFESLDVFVFTLGLTEAWRSKEDGAIYPLCPGVAGGVFNTASHEFHNFTVDEVFADILSFVDELRAVNAKAKVILTVSPVPLVATAEPRHVLVSTTYSKSVLRVACEMARLISKERMQVAYFPSYEIITGAFTRGRYFASDLRSVTEDGVAHVMRLFLRHYAGIDTAGPLPEVSAEADLHTAQMARLVDVDCDELAYDNDGAPRTG